MAYDRLEHSTVRATPHLTYYTYSSQYKQNLTTCCTAYPKILIVTQSVRKISGFMKITVHNHVH